MRNGVTKTAFAALGLVLLSLPQAEAATKVPVMYTAVSGYSAS
jgi:hypothetical protein